jgi:hypothetical protein
MSSNDVILNTGKAGVRDRTSAESTDAVDKPPKNTQTSLHARTRHADFYSSAAWAPSFILLIRCR